MVGLEVLMKQVRAISTVTHNLGGHVTSMLGGMLTGQMASPLMRSHLVLGNIRILASLLKDAPDLDNFDYEFTFGTTKLSDQEFWRALYIDQERASMELERLEQVMEGIREAIAQVQQELAMLRAVSAQLAQVLSGVNQTADALVEAKEVIELQVIPEVEQLLADLLALLDRYDAERQARDLKLWQQRHVFRFRFRLARRLKRRRQRKLAEELARLELEKKKARENKEEGDEDAPTAEAAELEAPEKDDKNLDDAPLADEHEVNVE